MLAYRLPVVGWPMTEARANGAAGQSDESPPENIEHYLAALRHFQAAKAQTAFATVGDLPGCDFRVPAWTHTSRVIRQLEHCPELPGVLLFQNTHCLGMISRQKCLEQLSQLFGNELFLQRPIGQLYAHLRLPLTPLPAHTPIDTAVQTALSRAPEYIYEPLVVELANGGYKILDLVVLLLAQSCSLGQANRRLQELDSLKSTFLANMSHELRTPLNAIIGFSRVLLKDMDGPLNDTQRQDLTAIYNSGQHLLGLINNILDISKIEADKLELHFDEVHLPEIIDVVAATATGLLKDKPVRIEKFVPDNLPPIAADPMRVRQILLNLVSNACKFTAAGQIEMRVRSLERHLEVSVSDTGIGIALEHQHKLFEPFSQVDDSPTRQSGGTGLGLNISRRLVEMHGGRIWVDSWPGRGSTFYFTLPRCIPAGARLN